MTSRRRLIIANSVYQLLTAVHMRQTISRTVKPIF